jgi:hypothetical protein
VQKVEFENRWLTTELDLVGGWVDGWLNRWAVVDGWMNGWAGGCDDLIYGTAYRSPKRRKITVIQKYLNGMKYSDNIPWLQHSLN